MRIVHGIDASDVIGKFVRRTTCRRSAAGGSRGLQLAVDGGNHGIVVRANLPTQTSGGSDGIVARLELAIKLGAQIRVDRRQTLLPRRIGSKRFGNGREDIAPAIEGAEGSAKAMERVESPVLLPGASL